MSTTKYDAMFAMVNMLLGTGPLILPSPCQQAGIILSVGWICIIGFISLNSAEFLVEAMARVNYIKREKKKELERSLLTEDNTENSELVDQTLQIEEPIEIGEMASILSGRKAEIFATIILTLYLLGVIISKCIMTGILFSILGNTLSVVFDGIPVLDSIYIWLGVFFVSGSVFSFRNVSQTKILQFIIIIVRFLSVLAMIVGAIYIIIRFGNQGLVPDGTSAVNFQYFPQLFSNTIFGLLCHHSIPSIVATVSPAKGIKQSIRYGFMSSIITVIIIPVTAIMAFGTSLSDTTKGNLKYYNFDFKQQASPVYYLVSFYVFLNVAAVPVLTIVLRNNILKLVAPTVNSKVLSSKYLFNKGPTLIATLSILGFVLVITLVAQHYIEYVLMFTGGICGVFILMMFPAYLVLKSRKSMPKVNGNFIHEALLKHWIIPYLFIGFGYGSLIFNLIETIFRLTKK